MIKFEEVRRGYDKEQVEEYIKTINGEYQKVLEDYQALVEEMEETQKDTSKSEAIASALINAEIAGKQIVANAQLEAKRVTSEATREVNKITKKKNSVLKDVDKLSKMLTAVMNGDLDAELDEVKEDTDPE